MPRRSDRSGGRLLDLMALFGALGIVAAVVSAWLGLTPLIVAGSSMEPSVPLGSLAIARSTPADRVVVGDVVSVEREGGARVTHRVVGLEPVGPEPVGLEPGGLGAVDTGSAASSAAVPRAAATELTLRGDANPSDDATRPVVTTVDRVEWVVPGAGSVVRALRSPLAAFCLGMFAAVAFWSSTARRSRHVAAVLWLDGIPHRLVS